MPQEYMLELLKAEAHPLDRPWEDGIVLEADRTKPFVIEHAWSGPAGNYIEQCSIRRKMDDVVWESEPQYMFVRGMQLTSEHRLEVRDAIELEPGTYLVVFVVEGLFMGSAEVQVRSAADAAA